MNDCLFCKIIKREIPATVVYEDTFSMAFLSISPNNQGHTLVVPKRHCRNIFDMEEVTISTLSLAVRRVSHGVHKGTKSEGVNIIMNNEPAAGQVIFHAHIHVIPRYKDDGLHVWDKTTPYQNDDAEKIAGDIRKEIIN